MEITDNTKKALDILGQAFVDELTRRLLAADKVASAKLIRSLKYKIIEVNNKLTLHITAEKYLDFVDKGRKPGKQPPTSAIKKWIDDKGISVEGSKDGVAFVIARSIGKKGIKPTQIITKTMNYIIQNKSKILEKAFSKDIEDDMVKYIKNIFI